MHVAAGRAARQAIWNFTIWVQNVTCVPGAHDQPGVSGNIAVGNDVKNGVCAALSFVNYGTHVAATVGCRV